MHIEIFRNYSSWQKITSWLVFVLVTISFHFFFRHWASSWNYYPIKKMIIICYDFLSQQLYVQSKAIVGLIFELNENNETRQLSFMNGGVIGISDGCSGLKQMLQFLVLFLCMRGSLRHKFWFIPLGILMMHLTNLFRIIGLSFFVVFRPDYWDFAHDYFFRPLFYVVIFMFWVCWIEKFQAFKPRPE